MIFIDGDGPLQDFAQWMVDNDIPLGYNRMDTESMFHANIDKIFLDSPKAKYLYYFTKMYNMYPEGEVKVLTAVGDHWPSRSFKEQATRNKINALNNLGFFKDDIIVVDNGGDKIQYALDKHGFPNTLYDDKWSTIVKWEKAGGHGMFVPECYLRFEEAGHADRA